MNGGEKDAYFIFQETKIRDEMHQNIAKQTGKFNLSIYFHISIRI